MASRLVIALLVVLAGCSGISGDSPSQESPGGPTDRTTSTAHSTPPVTTTEADTTSPDATISNTVDYRDLTATEKRVFDAALEGEARFLEESIRESPHVEGDYFDPDALEAFEGHEYVRKNGTYYRTRTSLRTGNPIASYRIGATEGEPGENASVVPFSNLSSRERDPVSWAIENGSYGVPAGKWSAVPRNLSRADYVRYEGRHYELTYLVGDAWPRALTVEKVG